MAVNRFAGYRLAGQRVEDISNDLALAVQNLRERNTDTPYFAGIDRDFDVPGVEGAQVNLNVSNDRGPEFYYDPSEDSERKIMGNLEDALMMLDKHRPHVSLVWGHNKYDATGKDKLRIARAAEKGWREVIPQIPEGAIVQNAPVGGLSGDFERADLYMRGGFGPLQEDGAQYGFIKGGQINPLSPGVVLPEHAAHLGKRAAAAGDKTLAKEIESEASRRITNDVPENSKYDPNEDYDDYDPEWERMQEAIQALKDDPDELIAYQLYGTTPEEGRDLQDYRWDAAQRNMGYGWYDHMHPNRPNYEVMARGRRPISDRRRRRGSRGRQPQSWSNLDDMTWGATAPTPRTLEELVNSVPSTPTRTPAMEREYAFERNENNSQANLQEIESWMNASGPRGQIYRDMYGSNLSELTSGLQLNSEMSPSAAADILRSAVYQPGRYDREQVGRALLRLQDLGMVRRPDTAQQLTLPLQSEAWNAPPLF